MVTQAGSGDGVASVTLHLQFTRGRHGAGSRLDVLERPAGRVGLLSLRGWVDLSAQRGIERTLDDLAARGVSRLVVDCSALLHIDYRLVPRLADALQRFTREAENASKISHPNVASIFDFGETDDGLVYLAMEFVDGVNLRQLLAGSRISAREALAIVPQICDALQYAHDQGIVHRDIKPENILLHDGQAVIADFVDGLALISRMK